MAALRWFGIQCLLIGIVTATDVGDESCLLQTSISTNSRKPGEDEELLEDDDKKVTVHEHSHEGLLSSEGARAVPVFEINLDLPPKDRFKKVSKSFKKTYAELYDRYFNNPESLKVAKEASVFRGPESEELMGEMSGIAEATDIPVYVIHANQLDTPLQSLKGPYLKFLHDMHLKIPGAAKGAPESPAEIASQFAVPSYGSAGIIALDEEDGSVWHARNLGYALSSYLQKLTYNARFTKDGKEVYTSQMVFPLLQPFTAIRKGHNGYSYELNTRFLETPHDAKAAIANLYTDKRPLSGWTARKVLEDTDNYEDAVKAFSTTPYPTPEYNIISGVKKGVILARDPDSLAYSIDLAKHRYIIMTNFDYKKGDEKEYYAPNEEEGNSRREHAQKILDNNKITPELLQTVLNDKGVTHDNLLFQSLINVEHGSYETALPHCAACDSL